MENNLNQIFQEILKLKKEESYAVFDFDNTVIFNDIAEASLAYLTKNNLFKDQNLLSYKSENYAKDIFENYHKLLDDGKVLEAYQFSSEIFSGFSVEEIIALASEVIKEESEEIEKVELFGRKIAKGIKLREQVIELINFLKKNGVTVWVISASPETLVKGAMKYFNIETNLIGIRNVIVDGVLTKDLEKPMSTLEGKVDCIKKYISEKEKPLFGIGDSMNDCPMLEYSEIKVVVDRQNALAEKAKQNNWFLI